MNAIISTVLDLDAALGGSADLLLGGGFGLYLKHEYIRAAGVRTLLPLSRLPIARTTQDIDLFLRAEVLACKEDVLRIRRALDSLGCSVVPGSEWLKFKRSVGSTEVLIDLMVGPLGRHASSIHRKGLRARPKDISGETGLHAFATDEALGIEDHPMRIPLSGVRTDGATAGCDVLIPHPFPYVLMKLGALRDRINDPNKNLGRHHAMDLYRIIGLITEAEDQLASEFAQDHAGSPELAKARLTMNELFTPSDGLGRIRLLEYAQATRETTPPIDVSLLVAELQRLLGIPASP